MNMLHKIALSISARGLHQGWKVGSKTADNLNMECWVGAAIALHESGHAEAGHVAGYVGMVITARGYRETLHLAAKAREPELVNP